MGRNKALVWVGLALLLAATDSHATVVGLKQVQVTNGSQVDLLFDGKISKSQIQTEFFKDIIQISLSDTSVYPAKISSVNGGSLLKVFAYQYAPKLVRCRFTIKGEAENYRDRVQVIPNGKMLTFRMVDSKADKLKVSAAQANRVTAGAEEQSLLERVLKSDKPAEKPEQKAEQKPEAKAESKELTVEKISEKEKPVLASSQKQLAGGKPLPSPFRIFGKMAMIVALMIGAFLGVKRLMKGNSAISKLARNSFGKKQKMVEVLSNHYLGPKKSIAVIRVAGRTLVIGVTNESINLITQLSDGATESNMNMDIGELEDLGLRINETREARDTQNAAAAALVAAGAVQSAPKSAFSDMLTREAVKPSAGAEPVFNYSNLKTPGNYIPKPGAAAASNAPEAGAQKNSVRAQIRSRLEGMKQL